jgi:uncharacterized protein YpuA (DUF1002 family)
MRQRLEDTLRELHEQLAEANDLDAEQRELLRDTLSEIQATLDDSNVSSTTLAQRLQEATMHFSETHPTLTQTAGRIADLLSQMGI